MEIVRLHLARIDALNKIPVHGFVIKHPRAGAILVDTGVSWLTVTPKWPTVFACRRRPATRSAIKACSSTPRMEVR
jgi:hypothetical protein